MDMNQALSGKAFSGDALAFVAPGSPGQFGHTSTLVVLGDRLRHRRVKIATEGLLHLAFRDAFIVGIAQKRLPLRPRELFGVESAGDPVPEKFSGALAHRTATARPDAREQVRHTAQDRCATGSRAC